MKNIKQKKCKNCKGTGFIPLGEGIKGIKKCPVCEGTGTIETETRIKTGKDTDLAIDKPIITKSDEKD